MNRVLTAILLVISSWSNCVADEPLNWDVLRVANNNRKTFVETEIPESVRSLEGKPIHIRGYMVIDSVNKTKGIEKFAIWAETPDRPLNVNRWESLPLHKLVRVEMEVGHTTEFIINAPLEISGTISVDVKRVDGKFVAIYKIKAIEVSKATKREGFFPAAENDC